MILLMAALGLGFGVGSGCSGSNRPDTGLFEQAFVRAADPERSDVARALQAIQAGDDTAALAALDRLTNSARLTPAQRESLAGLRTELWRRLAHGKPGSPEPAESAANPNTAPAGR